MLKPCITFQFQSKDMNRFIFYLFLLTVFYSGDVWGKKPRKVHFDIDGKIVGGNETTIQSYPYQVYLLLYNGSGYFACGGSILNRNFVLTAAHCLQGMQMIYVRIGSTNTGSGGTEYQTTWYRSHPRYNSRTSDYDVGLVRIPQGMNLDGTDAQAIPLAKIGYDPPDGENVTLTGWGATSEGGNTSENLMVVTVPVVARRRCNELLPSTITSRMICAGVPEGGKDTCQGDSGGPAVVTSSNELVGITSFGYGCARANTPGVYARASEMRIRMFIKLYTGL